MTDRDVLDSVEQMLAEARDDVKHADQKASLLLAALGVGFAVVLGGQLAGGWDSSELTWIGQAIWWVGVAQAVGAVAFAGWAVFPRYNTTDEPDNGVTYWGHVAHYKTLEGLAAALDEQGAMGLHRSTHQLWRLSQVVHKKYRYVRVALVLAATGGLLLGGAAIFFQAVPATTT